MERLVINNSDGIIEKTFPVSGEKSMNKAYKNALNLSWWAQYIVYNFDHYPVWSVCKVDISAAAEALVTDEPLTLPAKLSAPLIDLKKFM